MKKTVHQSVRIDCWDLVHLSSGHTGIVTRIAHTGTGARYLVASEKLLSVPREAIVKSCKTKTPKEPSQ